MKKRIITGIVLSAILIPIILIPEKWPFYAMMFFFVIIGSHELFNMFSTRKPFPLPQRIICTVLSVATFSIITFSWISSNGESDLLIGRSNDPFSNYVALLAISMLIIFGMLVLYDDFDGEDVGKCLLAINYVALGCAAMVILRDLGVRFLIYMLIVTFSTDVFAFLFGIRFGRHKMCPKISPKKSWEGAFAGTIVATILGTIFAFFYGDLFNHEIFNSEGCKTLLDKFCSLGNNQDFVQLLVIIVITLVSSVLGQIGDLVASKLKRNYGIKDFGNIFPGHGGVLDRFDSSIFVALFLMAIFTILRFFFPLGAVL